MDIRQWPKEFTVEFIELYRNYPCLWRIKSSDYSDRNKRTNAYEKLCSKLHEIDETASKETVVRKVDSLRSNFRKELKKIKESKRSGAGTENVYIPKLWYFEKLQFLLDQETPRSGVSNISESESNEGSTQIMSVDNDTTGAIEDELEDNLSSTPISPISNSISFDKPYQATQNKKKKKRDLCDEVLEKVSNKLQNENLDEFDVIGQNIAYKLRGLSKEVKLMSEKFINEILFEAEIGNINKYTKMSLQQPVPNRSFPILQSHAPFQLHTSLEPQLPHYYLQKPVLSHTSPVSHNEQQLNLLSHTPPVSHNEQQLNLLSHTPPVSHNEQQLNLSVFPQKQQQSHNPHQPHTSQDLQIIEQLQSKNHLPTLLNLNSSEIMQSQPYSQSNVTTLQNIISSETLQYSQAEITKDSAMVGIRDYYEQSGNSKFSN